MAERDYSATPLAKKLGIREGARVLLLDAPPEFRQLLEPLPADVSLGVSGPARDRRAAVRDADVVIVFATERPALDGRVPDVADALRATGALWIAWPKKRSRVASELSFEAVQSIGLATGLVDNKSCAIDDTWQALRFVVRLSDRAARPGKRDV
ncbi:MAG: DUF3052 domain-containing protein [Chloroflexota bacterium]|nr:DUF3052 domain-containing protein [Chloroflexota bacterium]